MGGKEGGREGSHERLLLNLIIKLSLKEENTGNDLQQLEAKEVALNSSSATFPSVMLMLAVTPGTPWPLFITLKSTVSHN